MVTAGGRMTRREAVAIMWGKLREPKLKGLRKMKASKDTGGTLMVMRENGGIRDGPDISKSDT